MAYMDSGHDSLLPAWKAGSELIWQCRVGLVQVIIGLIPLTLPFGHDMLPDGLPRVIVRLINWLDILEINCHYTQRILLDHILGGMNPFASSM